MQSFEFLASLTIIFVFTLLMSSVLHKAELGLETISIPDQKFSDLCNIVYISNFEIKVSETKFEKSWCLTPKASASDFIHIWGWQ